MNRPSTTVELAPRSIPTEYWLVGGVVALVHAALFALDVRSPEAFFRADRAAQRFDAIQSLTASTDSYQSFIDALVRLGNIGDYGIHAALYATCGRLGVIAFQVLLAIAASVLVVYISRRVWNSSAVAVCAGLTYGLLPQSIAFPHQLLSEAISNPFLIFGTAGFLGALQSPACTSRWCASGLFFGIAGLVRPALILLPLVATLLLLITNRRRVRTSAIAVYLVSGFVLFVSWGVFILAHTGHFGPGKSNQDLGLNLSDSTRKVLLAEGVGPQDGTAPEWLPPRLTLPEYLRYVRQYPRGFANLYATNVFAMIADSGIGRLYVDVLGFGADARLQLQDPVTGWRAQLTNHGVVAMLKTGWRVAPGTITAGLLGALAFALINIGLLVAYFTLLRRGSPLWASQEEGVRRWCLSFLLILPLYVIATSQVVAYAPSRLRSQGEFAWAILACIGWAAIHRYATRRTRLVNAQYLPEARS
jgi:4-amino-4-deoxy-L-arabinose transferase-like glycosyltransferase